MSRTKKNGLIEIGAPVEPSFRESAQKYNIFERYRQTIRQTDINCDNACFVFSDV